MSLFQFHLFQVIGKEPHLLRIRWIK